MVARGLRRTSAAAPIAVVLAACGSSPDPVAPVVTRERAPAVAVVEVPRVAQTASARSARTSGTDTTPRQAEGAPRVPTASDDTKILLPCSPSDPGCGQLDTSGAGVGVGLGGGGIGGPIGIGSIGGGASSLPTIRVPAKPSGNAEIVTYSTTGTIGNADVVIAGMRPAFRRCYNRALTQDPALQGPVSLRLEVASDGSVTKATAVTQKPLDVARACIEARGMSAQFAPPDSGKAISVVITIKLTPPPPTSP